MMKQALQPPNVAALKERLRQLEHVHRPDRELISSGCVALDRHAEFHRGTLVEYVADAGSGAATMALLAAREACKEGGALVVVDRQLYPPAAQKLGIDVGSAIFVRPQTSKGQLLALHQSLGCKGVGAVLCWPDKLPDRAYRGLQLAAETSGALGLFVRPVNVRGDPTWCDVQLLIETLPTIAANRRLRIEVIRSRHGRVGNSLTLELNDETGTLQEPCALSMATAVANTATPISAATA